MSKNEVGLVTARKLELEKVRQEALQQVADLFPTCDEARLST